MAKFTTYDDLFDHDDELFEDPFGDESLIAVTMKSKSDAGVSQFIINIQKFEATVDVGNQPNDKGMHSVDISAKAAMSTSEFGGWNNKLALKSSGDIENTSTFKGLGVSFIQFLIFQQLHEELEGSELGIKIKHSKGGKKYSPPQLAFNYIKDWVDFKLRVDMEGENPTWEEKTTFNFPLLDNVIFGNTTKGEVKNWKTTASRTAGLFCNIPNTKSTVGFFGTAEMTKEENM